MKQALPDNIMLKDVHSSASGFSSVFLVQDAHCTSATVRVVVSPNMWVDGSGSTGTVTTEYLSRSFAAALLNGHSYTDIVSATQTILYRLPPSTSPRKIIQAILWQTLTHITRANVPASSNFDFSEQLYATLYRCTGDEERSAFYPTRTWRDLMGLQLVLMHAAGEKVMAERTEMILRLVSMRECFQRAMVETEKVAFQRVTGMYSGSE